MSPRFFLGGLRKSPLVRGLLLVAAVLVGVLALAAFGLYPEEPVRRFVEAKLRAAVGPAQIGRLHIVPARLSADIEDLRVETATFTLRIPRARLRFSAATLLGKGMILRGVEIERPDLVVRNAPAQARTPPPAPATTQAPVLVANLALSGGSFLYRDPALGGDIVLRRIEATGSLGSGALTVTAAGGTWARPEPLTVGPARIVLRVSPVLGLRLDQMELKSGGSRLEAAGELGQPGAWAPDIEARADLNLAELGAFLGGKRLDGSVHARLHVAGTLDHPRVEMNATSPRLVIEGWGVQGPEVEAHLTDQEAKATLRAALLGGHLSAEARLRLASPSQPARFARPPLEGWLQVVSLDAARLAQALGTMSDPVPVAGRLGGRVTWGGDPRGTIALRARLDAEAPDLGGLRATGHAEAVGNLQVAQRAVDLAWSLALGADHDPAAGAPSPGPTLEQLRLDVTGVARGPLPPDVEGEAEGMAVVRGNGVRQELPLRGSLAIAGGQAKLDLAARGLEGTMRATVERVGEQPARLVLEAETLQLDRLVPAVGGRLSASLDATAPFDRPSGRAQARIDGLTWRNATLGDFGARLQGRDGSADFSAELPALHALARGRLTLGDASAFTGDVTLAETPLNVLGPAVLPNRELTGTVTARAQFQVPLGAPSAAQVHGQVEHLDVASKPWQFAASRPFEWGYAKGRLSLTDLQGEGSGLRLSSTGSIGLGPPGDLDLQAALTADLAGLPLPEGWRGGGSAGAEARLTGTLARPLATGAVTFSAASLAGPSLPLVRIAEGRIDLKGDHAETKDLTAAVAEGSLRVSAFVPFSRPDASNPPASGPVNIHVVWEGLQAAALASAFRPTDATAVQGALSGDLQAEGRSWSALRGTVESARSELRLDDMPFEIAPFGLRIQDGRVATEGITVTSEGASFTTSGSVDLRSRGLDLVGKGKVDLRALSPLLSDTGLAGAAEVDVSVAGTLDAPRPLGRVQVRDGTLRMRTLPQALTGLEGALVFDETRVSLEGVSAAFGGGRIELSGGAGLAGGGITDANVKAQGRDLSVRYPEGLNTRLNVDFSLTGRSGALQLSGTVTALRGLYDLDAALRQSTRPVAAAQESALLRQIGLDIAVGLESPIRVRGDLAEFGMGGSLRVRGDMQEPAPFGRLEIERQGRLKLQEGNFDISSGWLLYEGTWDPRISLEAQQREGNDIARAGAGSRMSVSLQGTLGVPTLTVRSDQGISTLGQTGLTMSGATDDGSTRLVGGQAASLLADRLTGGFRNQLKGLGFDEVTIQPELLAREKDVGARFTFRKNLTRRVDLLYSLSLNNPEDRFIRLEARPQRSVTVFGQREDVGSLTLGAGQRLRLGGPPRTSAPRAEARVRIESVRFEGMIPLPEDRLRKKLSARAGRRVNTWDVQEDADRLRRLLREANFLEAEVSGHLEGGIAIYDVRPGLPYIWRVEGMDKPPALEGELHAALFEDEALDRGRALLLRTLQDRGHYRAEVSPRAVTEGGKRALVLIARPGPRFRGARAVFLGATSLGHGELLSAAGGMTVLLSAPARAAEGLRAVYRERHFLMAQVDPPQFTEAESTLVVSTAVREGPVATIASIRFEGASLPEEELTKALALPAGSPPDEGAFGAANQRLREFYLTRGYGAVRVVPRLHTRDADYDLAIEVQEGQRVVVGSVEFVGLRRTRASLVRSRVNLKAGDPLDPRKLAELERKLLDLGVFSRVVTTVGPEDPATVTVTVEEDARFLIGYDFRYNQDDKSSARGDAEYRNIFGCGLAIGGRYTVGTDLRESRGSIHVPSIGPSGDLTFSIFRLDEDLPVGDGTVLRVQKGVEFQGKRRLPDRWNLLYGYRFRRVGITDFVPVDVGSVDVSFLRDSRDNILDPRRGRFLGRNLEMSARRLASDFSFLKGFAQASFVRPLAPRLFWAHAYRVGLAHVLDDEPLFSSERFTAGGANTVRGFPTDSLGPRTALGDPAGGQAVVVLNQELRWDARWGLGAVAFYDGGNVFASVRDVSFDVRHVLGTGLRWRSPVGVVRFDVGLPLSREPGEKKYRVFLSLGQAF